MNGSKKTSALTHAQFDFIVRHFLEKGDTRMAIICMLLGKCIRISDVLNTLTKFHMYHSAGEPRTRLTLVEQKTGKARVLPIDGPVLQSALREYWIKYAHSLPTAGRLFYNHTTGERLRDKGVKYLLQQFVGQQGIEQCSPHSFRKYGARFLFDQGLDIEVVSQVLNHSSVRETRTYLDIKPKEVEAAMAVLNY